MLKRSSIAYSPMTWRTMCPEEGKLTKLSGDSSRKALLKAFKIDMFV
jgi:hypothetical protein